MATKKPKKSDLCPICGQYMDVYCTGHRRMPFVDGQCYDKMCFICYHVPKTERQIYDEDGDIEEVIQLPFCHKHLHTAQELYDAGTAEKKMEAIRAVRGVRAAIKKAKLPRKPKPLKKPQNPGIELND